MHFVIIGAGQAGQSLAFRLRKQGFEGEITLIGEEAYAPYQRPPLSKKYLLGEMTRDRLLLKPEQAYTEQNITLRTATKVHAIDPGAKTITLSDDVLGYDKLALTTGSVARTLPAAIGGQLGGVFTVRTLADIDHMAPQMVPGKRLLVVGGGYIGLEAAAVATKMGVHVTLIEAAPRILGRVASEATANYFRTLHQDHGVDLREGIGLTRLIGQDHVTGAVLSDGTEIAADSVIVGIGILPATELAEQAGLQLDNGIAVDAQARTSDPDIFAAGDCAAFPYRGRRIRLESVQNAIDQAESAADAMLGQGRDYAPIPWFWSDQYDTTLQIAGLNHGYTRVVARPGSREGALSLWYFGAEGLLAVDAINDARAYMVGKRLLEAGRSPDPDQLADPAIDLKSLLQR